MSNYYTILGVDKSATLKQIKKAYRKLAAQLHPDKTENNIDKELLFKKVSIAYKTLKDPNKRKLYNETGTDDFNEINIGAQTVLSGIAINYIENCISQERIITFESLISSLIGNIEDFKLNINEFKNHISKASKLSGKIKIKNNESNLFENIISDKISELETGLSNCKKGLAMHEIALELLNQYESVDDVPVFIGCDYSTKRDYSAFGDLGAAR